jgi:hypothetical protein
VLSAATLCSASAVSLSAVEAASLPAAPELPEPQPARLAAAIDIAVTAAKNLFFLISRFLLFQYGQIINIPAELTMDHLALICNILRNLFFPVKLSQDL